MLLYRQVLVVQLFRTRKRAKCDLRWPTHNRTGLVGVGGKSTRRYVQFISASTHCLVCVSASQILSHAQQASVLTYQYLIPAMQQNYTLVQPAISTTFLCSGSC